MLFSTVWLGKENGEDRKPGREFSLPGPQFSSSQIRRKIVERKVLSQHFYRNALRAINTTATNTTIFLSNISKLKHNQIIRIQTQKHNLKINQIITIKAKNKIKKMEDRSHLTHLDCVRDEDEHRYSDPSLLFFLSIPLFLSQIAGECSGIKEKEKEKERVGEKKRVRACWNVLECEGEKENKTGGGNRDRLDTCV